MGIKSGTKYWGYDSCPKRGWMLTHQLALHSSKKEIRQKIGVADNHGPTKGKEYNDAIVPFVDHVWNVDAALPLSDSFLCYLCILSECKNL